MQAQLCAHEIVDATARQYSIGFLVTFDERERALDPDRLRAAFERVVAACDALRMELVTTSDGLGQIVVPTQSEPTPFETISLESRVREVGERRALRELVARVHPPHASESRRARARLVVLGERSHALLFQAHHAFFDDGSYRVMLARLEREYEEPGSAGPAPSFLPHLPDAMPDATRSETAESAPILSNRLAPFGHDAARGSSHSRLFERRLGEARRAAIARVARSILGNDGVVECGNIVFAAFSGWLARIDAEPLPRALEIGMPTHRRKTRELRDTIGMLQRPVRVTLPVEPGDDLVALARRVHESARSAIRAAADSHEPLDLRAVDAFFNNMPVRAKRFAQMPIRNRYLPRGSEPSFVHGRLLGIDDASAALGLELRVDVVGESLAARALPQLLRFLDAWLETPGRPLASIPLESDTEVAQRRAVETGAALEGVEPSDATCDEDRDRSHESDLVTPILAHAARPEDAHRIALREGSLVLDYAALRERVEAKATQLGSLGAERGRLVAVESPRSVRTAIFALAALRCGAIVGFVDPRLPAQRRAAALEFLQPALVVRTNDSEAASERIEARAGARRVLDEGAAFVVHTSGSTGAPRAIVLSHRALLARHAAFARRIPFRDGDVAPWKTSLAFVDSIAEWIDPLLAGSEVAIVDDTTASDARALVAELDRIGATRLTAVPSLLSAMLAVHGSAITRICAEPRRPFLPRLRSVVSSGEEISPALATRLRAAFPSARLFDVWGSSETTADATIHELREQDLSAVRVPIGRPIDGVRVSIVDAAGAPLPLGALGEIAVAGECLALGELAPPQPSAARALSQQRFAPIPEFAGAQRAFRTGDRGRFAADGCLEFHGRVDRRMKIRGIAVEPGAVEMALRAHPSVAESAVVGVRDERGAGVHLRAIVVSKSASAATPAELREHLGRDLLAASIPREIVFRERLPRLPSGKVDFLALASSAPDTVATKRATDESREESGRAFTTERPALSDAAIEHAILAAVRERLRDPGLDADADFFASGGDSLLAIEVALAIEKRTGLPVPIGALARFPTARALALHLCDLGSSSQAPGSDAGDPTSICIPLWNSKALGGSVFETVEPPVFLVPPAGYDVGALVPLARRLAVPLVGLQPRGITPGDAPEATIESMAARYVEAIRRVRPEGPYRIGGRCFGGIVAFEIVRQLEATGAHVDAFVLIDVLRPPGLARIASERIPDSEIATATDSDRSRLVLARHQLEARQVYVGGPIRAPALYVSGGANPIFDSTRGAWETLLRGGMEIVHVAGGHRNLMTEPRVSLLAEILDAKLRRADATQ